MTTPKPGKHVVRDDLSGTSLFTMIATGYLPTSLPSGESYAVVSGGIICEIITDPENGKPLTWWCHCSTTEPYGFGETLEEARADRYRKAGIAMGLEE